MVLKQRIYRVIITKLQSDTQSYSTKRHQKTATNQWISCSSTKGIKNMLPPTTP